MAVGWTTTTRTIQLQAQQSYDRQQSALLRTQSTSARMPPAWVGTAALIGSTNQGNRLLQHWQLLSCFIIFVGCIGSHVVAGVRLARYHRQTVAATRQLAIHPALSSCSGVLQLMHEVRGVRILLSHNSFHIMENRMIGADDDDSGGQPIVFVPHCPMIPHMNVLDTSRDHMQHSVGAINKATADYANLLLAEDHALRSSQAVLHTMRSCAQ